MLDLIVMIALQVFLFGSVTSFLLGVAEIKASEILGKWTANRKVTARRKALNLQVIAFPIVSLFQMCAHSHFLAWALPLLLVIRVSHKLYLTKSC